MKIKTKITFSLGTILIVLGIILNISTRNILIDKMETTIKESLTQLMGSTTESIKYRVMINSSETDEDKFKNESNYLMKYLTLNNEYSIEIKDNNDNVLADNTNDLFKDDLNKINLKSRKGSAVIYIKYIDNSSFGLLSYPIYINNNKLGVVNITKEYNDLYSSNLDTINMITLIEIIIFLLIFFIAYIITTKITGPIVQLTEGVKKIEEGNYDFSITPKGNDEVSILSSEFINMKEKIKDQIQTINAEKDKVETLETHRKVFFDNVTHELKTPLTAITGYAEMLRDDMVSDEDFKKRALDRIYSESQRIHNLVLDLIEVSKGRSKTKEELIKININDLISEIINDMNIKANKYSLNILSHLEDGVILGQQNKIKQLFINLLDNAIKYSKDEFDITVTSKSKDNFYHIEIKNSSNIIPEEIFNSIFNPFVKTSDSKEESSSGLGLYISKEIVNEHKGELSIINGEIVTINVKLPLLLTS
ncbi:ATP-binding protein [Clostridium paraputrificum]|uniref:HAMP domain-containing sensor histidine kinase n=1 Tax=Clostridium paraputrificum TaxID=29363 RepID=UPI003D34965F